MAIDPNKKFLYINRDTTLDEMDEALCFPVSSFIGAETQASSFLDLYFKGSKGTDATVVRVNHESFALIKTFYKNLVDEINFGENAFINIYDHGRRNTFPSDVSFRMSTDVQPTFTLQDTDFIVGGDNLTFDSVQLTGIQTSSESFSNDDVSLMTSAAIEDKILSYGYSTTSGDITAVTITTDSGGGSAASDASGSADFSILGANGVGVTNSGTTITAVAVPGEIDHDSLQNFVANEHIDWTSGGAGSIHGSNIPTLNQDTTGTAATVTTAAQPNITTMTGVFTGSANQILTDDGDGTVTSESNLTYDSSSGGTLQASSSSFGPILELTNSASGSILANTPQIAITRTATGVDDMPIGRIEFKGDDASNNVQTYAQIVGEIAEADHGSEEGKLTLNVASHDAELQPGLIVASGDTEDEVDVFLGNGIGSATNIAGALQFLSSDAFTLRAIDNAGGGGQFNLELGSSANTTGGIVMSGAAHLNLNADGNASISGTNQVGKNVNLAPGRGTGTGRAGNVFMQLYPTHTVSGTGSTSLDPLYHQFGHDAIDLFAFATGTSGSLVTIHNNDTTVGNGGELQFKKNAADTEDGEVLGKVTFYGEDEGNNNTQFAEIVASISESDETDEAGKLEFKVAESDGTNTAMTTGLLIEGEHATDGQIDVTIGAGSASTTTIPGVLSVLSGITFDGVALTTLQTSAESFADNDTSLMTSAAIDDRINAAGGGVSVADSNTDTAFPVVFHDESNNLLDDTSGLTYNPNSGNLVVPGSVTAKTYQSWPCSFFDDPGTSKIYLPFSGQSNSEISSDGNTFTDMVAPCNMKIHEVMLKMPGTTTGSGDITIGIETSDIGASTFSKSVVETETVTVASSNDNDIVHFMFDTATHATRGQNVAVTFQSDTDLSGNQNWYVNVIVEFDWGTKHSGSSAIQTS